MSRDSKLTVAQETVARTFIEGANRTELKLDSAWVMVLYEAMGYKVAPNGALVHKDTVLSIPYNTEAKDYWEDVYEADGKTFARTEVDADASASESAEGN